MEFLSYSNEMLAKDLVFILYSVYDFSFFMALGNIKARAKGQKSDFDYSANELLGNGYNSKAKKQGERKEKKRHRA